MKIINKLDKSFGPAESAAGIFLFLVGIVTLYVSLLGLILVMAGAFLGFTFTCTMIDFEKRRIKFSEKLFGLIDTGKWIDIEPGMKIGIKESNTTWRTFSRSNRSIDAEISDFRLILFDSENQEIMPVKKFKSFDSAQDELKMLCVKLEISELD